ncbi:MAG: hypothetical protein LBM05_00545 [Endomicrobium sp.]|jgi:hypothetical protein|nr:hypothetical protein [Endomicrobium sp.]
MKEVKNFKSVIKTTVKVIYPKYYRIERGFVNCCRHCCFNACKGSEEVDCYLKDEDNNYLQCNGHIGFIESKRQYKLNMNINRKYELIEDAEDFDKFVSKEDIQSNIDIIKCFVVGKLHYVSVDKTDSKNKEEIYAVGNSVYCNYIKFLNK